jgi:acetolactate decarboxylase
MDREKGMAHIAVKISSLLEGVARDLSAERKTSLDHLVSAALSEYLLSSPRRMYQISTSTALVEGVYSGSVLSSALFEHGDFGVGTFEGLDGEMVILDGEIYQAAGNVRRRSDDFLVPFASITHFREDAAVQIEKVACLKDIELACDPHRISENLFYALRVDGVFDTIHARAVHPVPQGSRLLDAAKTQLEFRFENVEGTLVCLWSPKYSSSFSVPGYHFHFISKDRTKGGHVLDCSARRLRASIQIVSEYDVRLPEAGSFLTTDLSRDPASDLAKAE